MPRVKRGLHHSKRRRNILKKAKGFEGKRKSHIKMAKTAVTKAGAYAYADRRKKKRTMRGLWQVNINAAVRPQGLSYSRFMAALKAKDIKLDRKILAGLAAQQPEIFAKIVATVK